MANEMTCENCNGTGVVNLTNEFVDPYQEYCQVCGGKGATTEAENNSILQEREVAQWRAVDESRENDLIVTLCREAGDTAPDADLIEGFRSNYHPDVIAAAARGDVGAIVELRQGCGLPIFS